MNIPSFQVNISRIRQDEGLVFWYRVAASINAEKHLLLVTVSDIGRPDHKIIQRQHSRAQARDDLSILSCLVGSMKLDVIKAKSISSRLVEGGVNGRGVASDWNLDLLDCCHWAVSAYSLDLDVVMSFVGGPNASVQREVWFVPSANINCLKYQVAIFNGATIGVKKLHSLNKTVLTVGLWKQRRSCWKELNGALILDHLNLESTCRIQWRVYLALA